MDFDNYRGKQISYRFLYPFFNFFRPLYTRVYTGLTFISSSLVSFSPSLLYLCFWYRCGVELKQKFYKFSNSKPIITEMKRLLKDSENERDGDKSVEYTEEI